MALSLPTEVISAMLGAVSGGGVTWVVHRQEASRQRVQQVRDVLMTLLDLREQQIKSDVMAVGGGIPAQQGSLLTQRRSMLLAVAESLAGAAERSLTAPDWLALAIECERDRNFSSTRMYYERAVRCARKADAMTQVYALRNLATYRFNAGPDHDAVEGTRLFGLAADVTRSSTDPYLCYVTGYTLACWAWWVVSTGGENWRPLVMEAKRKYRAGRDGTPVAQQALELLERDEQAWLRGDSSELPTPSAGPPSSELPVAE
jgi:hypothetical protein